MSYAIVKPSGLLDRLSASHIRNTVSAAMAKGADTILIDAQDITFMNSIAIGALVATVKAANAQKKNIYFCSLNPQVNMIFELTRLKELFQIFEDVDAFKQHCGESNRADESLVLHGISG